MRPGARRWWAVVALLFWCFGGAACGEERRFVKASDCAASDADGACTPGDGGYQLTGSQAQWTVQRGQSAGASVSGEGSYTLTATGKGARYTLTPGKER